ncbi:MAG: alanine racemase [Candidatus Nanopelagicales bacterium]
MSFVIQIQTERWLNHQREVLAALRASNTAAVPVAKGNGYGVGNQRLARQVGELGAKHLAVGTVHEVPALLDSTAGLDLLVLEPLLPVDDVAIRAWSALAAHPARGRVIITVSSVAAAALIARVATPATPVRILLEGLTSLRRFGVTESELAGALTLLAPSIAIGAVRLDGLALHLPIATPASPRVGTVGMVGHSTPPPEPMVLGSARVHEVVAWGLLWPQLLANLTGLADAGALWVSHLSDAECLAVTQALPELPLRLRLGTRLWLGAPGALQARGTVLAVHALPNGESAGYHQRRGPKGGHIAIVSGGTSHGVALVAPRPGVTMRQRAAAAGSGALEAAGRLRAPFHLPGGGQTLFLEPPHMHVSLLRVPRGTIPPPVGERLDCDVRFTTVLPDAVEG